MPLDEVKPPTPPDAVPAAKTASNAVTLADQMALSTQAELNALRAKNQEMATELRELAAELAQAKSLIPNRRILNSPMWDRAPG